MGLFQGFPFRGRSRSSLLRFSVCVKPFPAKALSLVDNRGTFSISSKVKIFFDLGLLHIDFSLRLRALGRMPPILYQFVSL